MANASTLIVSVGLYKQITKIENDLLKQGFQHVISAPNELISKQYTRREIADKSSLSNASIPSVIITWRP